MSLGNREVCCNRHPIAFAGDLYVFTQAYILDITGPAPSCRDVHDKAVNFCVVTAPACHVEVLCKRTAIEIEPVYCPGKIAVEVEVASVCATDKSWCEAIPVKGLGQVIDLGLDRGERLGGIAE